MLQHPVFSSLSPADRAAVEARLRVLQVKAGQVLVNAGQPCAAAFFVVAGKVRVETPSDDKTFALTGFLQAGDFYVETLSRTEYSASNTLRGAMTSTVQAVPVVVLQTIIGQYPHIGLSLLQVGIDRAQKLRRQLRRLKVEPVKTQVARAVYDAAQTTADGQRVLDKKITQSDLAEVTGLSREAVNKGLKQLSEAELLRKSERGLEVNPNLASTDFQPWNDDPSKK